ncbi:stalk domain-containing protein [Paenibacillus ferrarius]|uniref:stalk domain-containing protein n=1 Tax=Paenibacillus ferrarius TaxID=1469647 RepID=UPI003D2BB0C1
MKTQKRILILSSILCFIASSVNASSKNGDFEGNPIVNVTSNGTTLASEDVPALIYKGRTMVPINLLRQLGADVSWNDSTYSVNVALKNDAPSSEANLNELSKDIFTWLNDTNQSMLILATKLQMYSDPSLAVHQDQLIDTDFDEVSKLYNESTKFSLDMINSYKIDTGTQVTDMIKKQLTALDQISQAKNLLKLYFTQTDNQQMKRSLNLSIYNCLTVIQQNINLTSGYEHAVFLQQYSKNITP